MSRVGEDFLLLDDTVCTAVVHDASVFFSTRKKDLYSMSNDRTYIRKVGRPPNELPCKSCSKPCQALTTLVITGGRSIEPID